MMVAVAESTGSHGGLCHTFLQSTAEQREPRPMAINPVICPSPRQPWTLSLLCWTVN